MSLGRRAVRGRLAHSRRSELRSGRSVLVLQVSASPAPGEACPLPTVPYTPFTSSSPPSQFVINCFLDDCLSYLQDTGLLGDRDRGLIYCLVPSTNGSAWYPGGAQ